MAYVLKAVAVVVSTAACVLMLVPAAEWQRQVSEAGLHVRSHTRQPLRLEFSSWVERMRTPEPMRVAIRQLQQAMGEEVRQYYQIDSDGSFSSDVLVLWAER